MVLAAEAESLQLDGQSFVVMALGRRPVTSAEDAVRLRFRTNHADGLLLYSRGSQRDLLALQLVHNRLLLSVDLGGEGLLTEVWCGSLLDDNVWHDVQVSRFRRQLVFTVDRVVVRQRLRGDSFQLDLNREASRPLSLSCAQYRRPEGMAMTSILCTTAPRKLSDNSSSHSKGQPDFSMKSEKAENKPQT